ncbi:hypothetical protein D3C73_1650360 [compost metagenome]
MILYAPIGVMADTTGLANHQVGGDQACFQCFLIITVHAIVMQEKSSGALDFLLCDRSA